MTEPPPWELAHAVVSYESPWVQVLSRYKFSGDIGLAWALAEKMLALPALAKGWADHDALVPIPISQRSLASRGYNQAERLARHMDPARTRMLLQRTAASQVLPPQHELTRNARMRNMAQAFSLRSGAEVAGRRLLLVDDVLTTGTTLKAATQVLLKAGAARVDVLVFARTEAVAHERKRDNHTLPRPV